VSGGSNCALTYESFDHGGETPTSTTTGRSGRPTLWDIWNALTPTGGPTASSSNSHFQLDGFTSFARGSAGHFSTRTENLHGGHHARPSPADLPAPRAIGPVE